jgi:hypothetical protein
VKFINQQEATNDGFEEDVDDHGHGGPIGAPACRVLQHHQEELELAVHGGRRNLLGQHLQPGKAEPEDGNADVPGALLCKMLTVSTVRKSVAVGQRTLALWHAELACSTPGAPRDRFLKVLANICRN